MKRTVLLSLCMGLFVSVIFAQEMIPTSMPQGSLFNEKPAAMFNNIPVAKTRTALEYTYSKLPTALMTSYYDYMIGSYNGLPLRTIPANAGGGYFMTYHGRRTATGTRRAFYAYLDQNGNMINNNEITPVNNNEGYSTLAVDPVSGKPMYAWHCNADYDAEYEVQFTSDAFIETIAGLFNEQQVIADSPITITPPNGTATTDNEFIWPTAQIGPSPVIYKRRVYVAMRNSVSHSYGPSENVYIAYADFNADDLEGGIPLVWSHTSIPEMNQWNHNATTWRRPFHAITTDEAGNLYYVGYHFATEADGTTDINEADMDVFKCPNYGQGTWTRVSDFSHIPSWNPAGTPGGTGYFVGDGDVAYPDNQLVWALVNSSHLNATVDTDGKIHVLGTWAQSTTSGNYWPDFHVLKEFVFNPANQEFDIRDVYPQKNPADTHNETYTPWDVQAPWGVPEYTQGTDGQYYLNPEKIFPFAYWDETAHSDNMIFYYNNPKISQANEHDMMVAVWQDSQYAKWANEDSDPAYAAYANTPMIYISVSPNNGEVWSEPIVLNNVDNVQFAGLKPMWVYPADKVVYVGMQNGHKVGKLGIMFYNDYTWGSNSITPPVHPTNNGGQVMFMELQIVFPLENPIATDPFGIPVVLSSSMNVMSGVMLDGQMASAGDVVAAYVNVNSVPQLRGKATVTVNGGIAGCQIQVYTENNEENVYFKLWDNSIDTVLGISETISSQVNGSVGIWPDNLFWLHASNALQQYISLLSGWNMISLNVHPDSMQLPFIFADILSDVLMVKSTDGVYIPGNPYNTLNQFTDGKGYYVRVNTPCNLSASGAPIDVSVPLPLASGWNLSGYTPQATIAIATALSSIAADIIQVKGVEGIYVPGNPYSTLTTLSPGRAYWMKLSNAASLVYPDGIRESDLAQTVTSSSTWGAPVLKTNSQAVLCALGDYAATGDLLAAFVNGELRGLVHVSEVDTKLGALLQVFTDSPNETIEFRLLRQNSNAVLDLLPNLASDPGSTVGDYISGEFYNLSTNHTDAPELNTGIISAYPNPFNAGTSIRLGVSKDSSPLKVEVYNLRGQKIRTLFQGQLAAGTNDLYWNGVDDRGQKVSSGVYFCRLQSDKTKQSIKLMVLK